jgi:hypothetical protein
MSEKNNILYFINEFPFYFSIESTDTENKGNNAVPDTADITSTFSNSHVLLTSERTSYLSFSILSRIFCQRDPHVYYAT